MFDSGILATYLRTAAVCAGIFCVILTLAACGEESESENTSTTGQTDQQGGTTQATADTWTYTLPGDQVYPEGIVYQVPTENFFVSSTTDGTIFRGRIQEGGGRAEVFLEGEQNGRTSAIGLALDGKGRLFVAGGETGRFFVYDTISGELIARFENNRQETFVNDVTVSSFGEAYFTDSFSPVLYRLALTEGGFQFEEWLDLTDTPIEYQDGFNLNGIVVTEDGRYLLVTHSNTGQLFRIDTQSQQIQEIDLGEEEVPGDGMVLDGRTLYAVVEDEIVRIELSEDYTSGQVENRFSSPSFKRPTTIDNYDGRMLVVNSQFEARESGDPDLPFTVSDVPIP